MLDVGAADGDHVAQDFDSEFAQKQLGDGADGDAGGGFAGRGALQNVSRFGEVVFERAGEVGMSGARRSNALMLGGIAFSTGSDSCQFFQSRFRAAWRSANRWFCRDARRRGYAPVGSIFMRPPRPYPCCRRQSSR